MTAQHSRQRTGTAEVQVQPIPGGYLLRGTDGPALPLQLSQGIVVAVGAALAGLAVVLLLPGNDQALGHGPLRTGLAVLLGAAAALMLWFGTRGGVTELHLDLAGGELREVVRHRVGRPTLLARHALDGRATLSVTRDGLPSGLCALVLRFGENGGLCIAQGPEDAVLDLRRRMETGLRGADPAGLLAA